MKTSEQIHEDARQLLEDTQIVDILSNLGKVHLIGSYATDLMWDPDIDIIVVTDNPQESAIQAINDMAKTAHFQKLEFGDFQHYPKKNRPESYIVNARKEWKGQQWEIETWFITKLDNAVESVKKLKKLSTKDKEAIIEKKIQRSTSGNTKHDLSSWEIYQDYI